MSSFNLCFNPRTHTGCDVTTLLNWASNYSFNPRTHTGCDRDAHGRDALRGVSIHAPTRGATWQRRHRCRTTQVSIHAPTRGATNNDPMVYLSPRFQSTHPHGVRQMLKIKTKKLSEFQSTHPHGVRPVQNGSCCKRTPCFNPRTHTGCDL